MKRLMLLVSCLALSACDAAPKGPSRGWGKMTVVDEARAPDQLSAVAGRFTLFSNTQGTMILDTATGRPWILSTDPKGIQRWVQMPGMESASSWRIMTDAERLAPKPQTGAPTGGKVWVFNPKTGTLE